MRTEHLHLRRLFHSSSQPARSTVCLLQMSLAERDVQLQRAETQNDLLSEKVKVLTNSLFAKEAHSKSRSRIPAQPVAWNSCGGGDGTLPSCSGDTDFSASDEQHSAFGHPMEDPRMQLSVVSAQCKALECELENLRADGDCLVRKLESATRGAERLPPMLTVTQIQGLAANSFVVFQICSGGRPRRPPTQTLS